MPNSLSAAGRPDAGEHQQLRRVVSARRQQNLALSPDIGQHGPPPDPDPGRLVAVEDETDHRRLDEHCQIRPGQGRMQVRAGCTAAAAPPLGHLGVAEALSIGPVQVIVVRVARLGRRSHERRCQRVPELAAQTESGPPVPRYSSAPPS